MVGACVRVPPLLEKQEKSSSINCRQVALACVHSVLEEIKAPLSKLRLRLSCVVVLTRRIARRTKRNHNIRDVGGTQLLGVFWMESREAKKNPIAPIGMRHNFMENTRFRLWGAEISPV